MKKRILIVGVGLIGGTIARGFKQNPDNFVIGIGRRIENLTTAKNMKIIDEFSTDFASEAVLADYIIFATPVKQSLKFMAELAELETKPNLVVSDAGSTKFEIVEAAEKLFAGKSIYFIGGHPMAGSHKTGAAASRNDLFENAFYILTPSKNVPDSVVQDFKKELEGLKARFIELDANEHDEITSMVSHLPHILASSLVHQTKDFSQMHPLAKEMAAGGFRDMTRIASSDARMWTDILLSNQEAILNRIVAWQSEMSEVYSLVERADFDEIMSFFNEAKNFRETMSIHKTGAIPAFYDLFVDVPDIPGVIHQVLGLFVPDDLTIINIKITESDASGVLQLSFKNYDDVIKAKELIKENTNYECHEI